MVTYERECKYDGREQARSVGPYIKIIGNHREIPKNWHGKSHREIPLKISKKYKTYKKVQRVHNKTITKKYENQKHVQKVLNMYVENYRNCKKLQKASEVIACCSKKAMETSMFKKKQEKQKQTRKIQ